MNCPACANTLQERDVDGVSVDVCDGGCGGIWFDKDELSHFDEPHESAGALLLSLKRDPMLDVDRNARYDCPRCERYVMQRHYFSVRMSVQVDTCPGCGGVFLDAGELSGIRGLFDSEEEREAASKEFWDEVFESRMADSEQEIEESLARSRRIAGLFRFLSPSFWLPGKQSWGSY